MRSCGLDPFGCRLDDTLAGGLRTSPAVGPRTATWLAISVVASQVCRAIGIVSNWIRRRCTVARSLIEQARTAAGLTREELARRAGTSRPTLSAYEHGRKAPRLDTAERILGVAGFSLAVEPRVSYRDVLTRRHRLASVPDRLPRLPVEQALGQAELPQHLDWSSPDRTIDLADRRQRARCYEIVLREGTPADIAAYVDGALLVDLWDELVLPSDVRRAWSPLIDRVRQRL
jgi:transcriptional regulator with XRE-family HTH domain